MRHLLDRGERPGFGRLCRAITQREIDIVAAWATGLRAASVKVRQRRENFEPPRCGARTAYLFSSRRTNQRFETRHTRAQDILTARRRFRGIADMDRLSSRNHL